MKLIKEEKLVGFRVAVFPAHLIGLKESDTYSFG
jgi:hypothetical protein